MDMLKALLAKLTGTTNPITSLTYIGLGLLLAGPEIVQHFGWIDLAKPTEISGLILMTLGIRRRLPS